MKGILLVMKSLGVLLFLLSTLWVNAQSPLGFQLPKGKNCYELSFTKESNLIIIPVMVNGKGPFNFILDTGSESNIIFDHTLLDSTQILNSKTMPIYAKDGVQSAEVLIVRNIPLAIDSLGSTTKSMLVLKENALEIRSILGVDAHGVLGSDFFARYVVEISYQNKKLKLYEHDAFSPERKYKKQDINLVNGRPYINVKLKQYKQKRHWVNLLVDTGASSALFLDHENYDFLVLPENFLNHTLGSSLIGLLKGKVGRVKKLKFQKRFKLKNILTSFPENWNITSQLKGRNDTINRHGTIGADVLAKFDVVFDYLNSSIYLRKSKDFRKPFKFNRAGFTFIAEGEDLNRYFISEIIKQSPAEANDLREGDEIMALNGKLVIAYSFSDIQNILRGEEGRDLDIIVQRNGELYRKRFKLKKLI